MRQRWADYRVFWREFRDAYHTTGAVLPSGRALSVALARFVRDGGEADSVAGQNGAPPFGRRILEVGPGTGAVTGQIIHSMHCSDRLDLVERNEQFVAHLRTRLADEPAFRGTAERVALLHAGVEELPDNEPYDLIVSGLPLNNFTVESVEQILAKMQRLLKPGGTLSFFEYVAVRRAKLLASPQHRQRLRGIGHVFDAFLSANEIRRDLVLINMPPAWVHHVRFGAGG